MPNRDSIDNTRTFVPLLSGTMVSHYRIIERIGAGGMGDVYRAHDDLLDRPVAVKFLSLQRSASEEYRRRFLREARAAARLRHQNIILTLDLGEHQSVPFIVFEYLEPLSLRDRMSESPLRLDEVYRISIGLIDAIGTAHRYGVIHRDIKPSNILLDTSGDPKLIDFGLAMLATLDADTRTAGVIGTIGYMAPEQARGEEVDERSDYFALGMVIYEMLTGVNPFRKDSVTASLEALLNDEPRSMTQYRDDLPARLDDVVLTLLQKDPASRYQCAEHLREDLLACRDTGSIQRPLRKGPSITTNRLAVLPFENYLRDDTGNRLGEMFAHLLVTGLSDAPEVSVVSGQRLHDLLTLEGLREIVTMDRSVATRLARRAEARWMILGTVLSESPLVLTTQLVDVNNGLLVKGHRFVPGQQASIFDAADQILATLKEDLSECVARTMTRPTPVRNLTTTSPDALRYYLEGFQWQARWDEEKAKQAYEKAIACDPMFAMAYYGLSTIPVPNRLALIEKAEALAGTATFRERCYIKAMRLRLQGDRTGSMAVLKELLERHNDEKLAYHWIGVHYHFLNSFDEAIKYLRKAIELDPLYTPAYNQLVYTLSRAGQFEESMDIANQYIQITPDDSNPYDTRAEVLGFNGRLEAALASYREALARQPVLAPSLQRAGCLYVLKQDYEHARELFNRLPSYVATSTWVDPHIHQVSIPLRQGKWRGAMDYLDRGIAEDSFDSRRAIHVAYKHELKAITFLELELNLEAQQELELALPTLETDQWYLQGMDFYLLYSRILARNGQVSRARALVEQRVKKGEAHEVVRHMRHLLAHGLVCYEEGDLNRATAFFEEADSVKPRWLSPEHFVLQSMLARLSLTQGRHDLAVELLEAYLNTYAESRIWNMLLDVKNHYYLGLAYEQSGWSAKAVAQYGIFLDIWKDADPGIKEIDDAKARLAYLKAKL